MNLLQEKKTLRKQMTQRREGLDLKRKQAYDQWVCHQLESLIENKGYEVVHAYLPMGKEINILPLIKHLLEQGKTVVCPKTLPNRKLENRVLTSLTDIEKGVFGTTHPSNPVEYTGAIDLIIVPGLAFDKNNYRLGYGGGYYDNFMRDFMSAYKIGICYPEQVVEKVPIEEHDLRLDQLLIGPY